MILSCFIYDRRCDSIVYCTWPTYGRKASYIDAEYDDYVVFNIFIKDIHLYNVVTGIACIPVWVGGYGI